MGTYKGRQYTFLTMDLIIKAKWQTTKPTIVKANSIQKASLILEDSWTITFMINVSNLVMIIISKAGMRIT